MKPSRIVHLVAVLLILLLAPPAFGAMPEQHIAVTYDPEKVSYEDQTKLPCMGISRGAALLVCQRDHLSGRGARKLAREDKGVPTM